MRPATRAAGERHRRERHPQTVSRGGPADQEPGQHGAVGGGDRVRRRQRDLELVGAVLGMHLLGRHPGMIEALGQVGQQRRDVQHRPDAVTLPGRPGAGRPVRSGEHELEFGAGPRGEPGVGERRDDPLQPPAGAAVEPAAVLVVEVGGGPGHAVLEDGGGRRVDPQPQVADHPEVGGERDARRPHRTPTRTGKHPSPPRRTPRTGRSERLSPGSRRRSPRRCRPGTSPNGRTAGRPSTGRDRRRSGYSARSCRCPSGAPRRLGCPAKGAVLTVPIVRSASLAHEELQVRWLVP